MSDHLSTEAPTNTTHNKHKRQTSMAIGSFKPVIPAIKRLLTYTLDHMDTGIGCIHH